MSDSINMYATSGNVAPRMKEQGDDSHPGRVIGFVIGALLWALAIASMVMLAFFAHTHRGPIPLELTVSRDVQAAHFPAWVGSLFRFLTTASDPIPDVVTVIVIVVLFVIMRWFWQAAFLALVTMLADGVDAYIGDIVGRPRPSSKLIHVDNHLIYNSFPSGHSCYMMAFYGFLLFLSFTKPVRESKYRWLAIPVQLWAILNILLVGFARIWEGEHWVTDVIGGYLHGAIWLTLFIVLYRWLMPKVQKHKIKKMQVI